MKLIIRIITGVIYGNKLTAFLRIALGLLFIYSGIFKVLDPSQFKDIILLYKIVPPAWAPYGAIIIPWIEVICGVMLFVGFKVRPASLILALLMVLFTIFIGINLAQGNVFDCGCLELGRLGLGINEKISISLVVRDIVLSILLFLIFAAERHLLSLDYLAEKMGLKRMI